MLDIQLGRRNLSPIQRIAITEKYRPIYEKQAKERQTKYYGNQYDKKSAIPLNLTEVQTAKNRENETNSKLADIAGVKPTIYKMGVFQSLMKVMRWMLDIQLGRRNLSPFKELQLLRKNVLTTKRKQKKNKQNIMVINTTKKVELHQIWWKSRTDYKITSEFVKKLSMTGNTDRHEQARQYFIAYEQGLKVVA